MDKYIHIDTFSSFTQVSRETITSLMKYEELLLEANKSLNLIGNSTINYIWHRHFLDSVQAIDFIDKNQKTLVDIGSGAGFPGLVLSIVAKDKKITFLLLFSIIFIFIGIFLSLAIIDKTNPGKPAPEPRSTNVF